MKPYAVHLLERFEAGETVEDLANREGIPVERIRRRLTAAAEYQRARLPVWLGALRDEVRQPWREGV